MNMRRFVKFLLLAPLAAGAAIGQGWLIFVLRFHDGAFVSVLGLKCVLVPVLIEVVVAVITLRNIDQLHAAAVANPHSPIGAGLRDGAKKPVPEVPPAREAWDGHWEDPNQAASKMAKDR